MVTEMSETGTLSSPPFPLQPAKPRWSPPPTPVLPMRLVTETQGGAARLGTGPRPPDPRARSLRVGTVSSWCHRGLCPEGAGPGMCSPPRPARPAAAPGPCPSRLQPEPEQCPCGVVSCHSAHAGALPLCGVLPSFPGLRTDPQLHKGDGAPPRPEAGARCCARRKTPIDRGLPWGPPFFPAFLMARRPSGGASGMRR